MSIARIQETLDDINQYSSSEKGITRIAFSNEERKAIKRIIDLCKMEGLKISVDPIGNVIARKKGKVPGLPAVVCGSHIDTVIEGGRFDGLAGVVAGLEVIRRLNEKKIETIHPVELIVFVSEESTRFGLGRIGSKAMTGLITENLTTLKNLKDRKGKSLQE